MPIDHLYDQDFPEQHKVKEVDVVSLYYQNRFEELDAVIICKDRNGKVTATFGDDDWDCKPFTRKKKNSNLSAKELHSSPTLKRELKILIYGWLFNKCSNKRKAQAFSTTRSKLRDIKRSYYYLMANNLTSLCKISDSTNWEAFKEYLTNENYSRSTIVQTFGAINRALEYSAWHKIDIGFTKNLESKNLARDLCSKEKQQTLVIPERLCDSIYGKAIELVECAHPHRELIENIEFAIQENYLKGEQILKNKVKSGSNFSFMQEDGTLCMRKYTVAIHQNLPRKISDIISPLKHAIPTIELENGRDFRRYLGQLINASYIVCGGFSGMRDSELDMLTPNSYYKDNFEGRDYHMLQSKTFKLGERRETWVTSSSAKIAIELMNTLTQKWRKEVASLDEDYMNTLWVNPGYRSQPPSVINQWNLRLQNFCNQFNFVVTKEDYNECLETNPKSREKIEKTIKVGKPWRISTHQFRRTLAFYCTKNRLGTLVALKQQFKHLSLEMTEWYTNGGKLASLRNLKIDMNIQQALEEANAESTANKIFKQWHSDETLSGTHGKAIMKMRGDIPTIYSSWDTIYTAVKAGKLTLHGSLHSYCKSGYDCDMDGVVTPQFCVDCGAGSSIIDEQQAKWWQKKHRSLVAYMESGEEISVSEHSHYVTQVRAAEKVMADFDMPFTPFEPDLKVANL